MEAWANGNLELLKACSNSTPPVLPLAESYAGFCVQDERQRLEDTMQGVTVVTYSKPCDALQHGVKLEGLLRRRT